ncbi:Rho-binding antiterminator [Methylomarinum sp. Ch1-1]|uniref:Rho-binding antiterminator n=1 Tax=Methylomarinum roseum TaxID=3067653 RepID=A0AAU7NT42_9GAMM|nr:Rho-binding antiterminator [Methylomarinum sp. Ch1-1]MDP4519880.1 Rho-binding antiterminator [Methylomarinum sp. Ch1-1]
MSKLISCQLHDYIEIACMYHYRIRLTLKNREVIEGRALDTCVDADKREYLLLDDGEKRQVELNKLAGMEVLSANPAFKKVDF